MDRYEVTNKQYKEFIDNGGYRNPEVSGKMSSLRTERNLPGKRQ